MITLANIIDRDTKLYLYKSEAEPSPDGTFSLTGCKLRDEGSKLGPVNRHTGERPAYHLFGLYLAGGDGRGPNSGVLLRMSSEDDDVRRAIVVVLHFFPIHHFSGPCLMFSTIVGGN